MGFRSFPLCDCWRRNWRDNSGIHRGFKGGIEHLHQASTQPAKSVRRDLLLEEPVDGVEGLAGSVDRTPPSVGDGDQLGAAVGRVGLGLKVTELHKVGNEFGHGLFRDAGPHGELGQSEALVGDVRHDRVVHQAVVVEAGGNEVFLQCSGHVAIGEHQEEEQWRVFVGIGHS